ncbi:hypothetical protein CAPTEDRAFT_225851 [Capitella teleta]|uniref:Peptidase S1 domain-containing protein n=1 Tax=Capitella teleta TaxID=283909 RepID=R7TUA0_CAPTE|nr:hypothetical protein CAPTEDRAFT_225851 [Capitella teleta]|eukprot:ELT94600.1 hypothetical protein CAPTEDRAFT_225851 [Capitella teleta]
MKLAAVLIKNASFSNETEPYLNTSCPDLVCNVNGYNLEETYITAGLHARDDHEFAQTRHMAEFTMHPDWCNTCAGYPNDLAIIRWDDPLDLDLPNVGVARLPDNNDNDFAGETCVVSGWGRIDSTPNMANELIKADMSVIFTDECAARLDPLMGGPSVFSQHICVFNSAEDAAPCNGDNGGPLNCPLNDPEDDRTHFVAAISSWFISSAGDCLLETPNSRILGLDRREYQCSLLRQGPHILISVRI